MTATKEILRTDHLDLLETILTNMTVGMSSSIHAAHPRYWVNMPCTIFLLLFLLYFRHNYILADCHSNTVC